MKFQAGWVWLPGRENSSGGLREGLFLNRLTVRRVLEALTTYPNRDNLVVRIAQCISLWVCSIVL